MRKLGLDLGERRIGIALSDPLGIQATPYAIIENKNPEELKGYIEGLIEKEGVDTVVVGMPLRLRGGEGRQAQWARRYAEEIRSIEGLEVVLWDERLTTREALRRLREGGGISRKVMKKSDSAAAAVLLQSYLDSRASSGDSGDLKDGKNKSEKKI